MADVSLDQIKDLRNRTGAGMGDCRKALIDCNGDIDAAVDSLRKAGKLKAAKKADRETNEGRITAVVRNNVAVIVEILCETDFVGKNEKFIGYCDTVAERALAATGTGLITDAIRAAEADRLGEMTNVVGENLQINRVTRQPLTGSGAAYVHTGSKIGVIVDVTGTTDSEFIKNLCMHIAAFSPSYLRPEDVPADAVAKERGVLAETPELQGKPADVVDKILDGKIRKWLSEICLVKQNWIWDAKQSVEKVSPKATIVSFTRWQIGGSAE